MAIAAAMDGGRTPPRDLGIGGVAREGAGNYTRGRGTHGESGEMAANQRQSQRYRVSLKVRYTTARDFVLDYAENLSAGGLFLLGAEGLEPGDRVLVELELPGFESFGVVARVAHALGAEEAARRGRRPGAGLRIVEAPDGFDEALRSYLLRLGRRRDHALLVEDLSVGAALDEAGYRVKEAPPPGELLEAVSESEIDVLAVVVRPSSQGAYEAAAAAMGAPELVRTVAGEEELDALLRGLDDELSPLP